MRLFATSFRRPGALIGTFVALVMATVIVTWTISLGATGSRSPVPPERLANAAAVVMGRSAVSVSAGTGDNRTTASVSLPAYRGLPAAVADRLATLPGVAAAVPEVSVPLALVLPNGAVTAGTAAQPTTGYGWPSAVLTPFRIRDGHSPIGDDQLVVGAGLARSARLAIGTQVRLAGRTLPPFEIVGIASAPSGGSVQGSTIFLSQTEATTLAGHPGRADLVGIVAQRGVPDSVVAARVRAAIQHSVVGVAGGTLTVLSGDERGRAEDLNAQDDLSSLFALSVGAGIDILLIALFVVAGAVALVVAARSRTNALLRAVGATSGQVRRWILAELLATGVVAGLAGVLPGMWLASRTVEGMASHQIVPTTTRAWTRPWELLFAVGVGSSVALMAGWVGARRAGRVSPTVALVESVGERRSPGAVRVVLGVGALAGAAAAAIATFRQASSDQQLNMALLVLLACLAAVALLGPLLVIVAELFVRLPLRLLGRAPGRLASSEIRARPRRMASAVVAVALTVAFAGGIWLVDTTQTHAGVTQGRRRLAAAQVVTALGPGLAPGALAAIAATPGVTAAMGVTPTTVLVPDPGNNVAAAEAVTPGPISSVLHLGVATGSLSGFRPGDIAVSSLIAGPQDLNVHVGQMVSTYLADGVPYRARVTAIYSRSLGFGDVLVPAGAAGGGHLGTTTLGEVLVQGKGGPALTSSLGTLAGRYPGLRVAGRTVVNAQAERLDAQGSYLNNLLLGIIALLAAVALINTLVVAALEQRESLLLLNRVGATTRQLIGMAMVRTLSLSVVGLLLGAAAGATAVLAVTRALTGTWHPYLRWEPVLAGTTVVLGLSVLAVLAPTASILRRR